MHGNKVVLLLAAAILCGSCIWTGGVDATTAVKTKKSVANENPNATTPAPTLTVAIVTEKFEPFPESQCHFPFWHNHAWHHTCVKYNNFGDFWCSLSANFTKDENWRRCRSPDLKRFQCSIPFEFQGKNHTKCLKLEPGSAHGKGSHHAFWCAVVPRIQSWRVDSTDWAYCEHENATSIVYLKAIGDRRSIPEIHAPSVVGHLINHEAVAAKAPVKSLTGEAASNGGPSSSAGAVLSSQAVVGISVGVVCSVLAVVAAVSGIAIYKRRLGAKDLMALLKRREKGSYGGVEASE